MHAHSRTSQAGTNVPAALQALAKTGINHAYLAHHLKVSRRTAKRWMAGQHQPNTRNFDALRDEVERHIADVQHRRGISSQYPLHFLTAAKEHLYTAEERQEIAELAARLRADLIHDGVLTPRDPADLLPVAA